MLTTTATVFIILICAAIFLFIARRILRLAIKIAFAGALIFVLLAGGAVGWWQGWFSSSSSSARRPPASQSNQRTNTNRRTPSR
jgi:multisubunit Na+/H+ antiporter MnhC subunit